MQIDLSDKTAVVSGSSAGIGFAIAKGLAWAGARVIVTGRDADKLDAAVKEIATLDREVNVEGYAVDLSTAEGCAELIQAHPAADILVNNLGIFEQKNAFELTDADWQRMFDVNVMSGVRLSKGYLPRMIDKGWGRVLFLSSESGRAIPADMLHYGVSKAAVLAVSRGLAKRVAGHGVTVNAVLPGPTLSEGVAAMLADDAEENGQDIEAAAADFVRTARPTSLLGRATSIEEVANLAVYLCSRQASGTTGAAMRVDGGVVDDIT